MSQVQKQSTEQVSQIINTDKAPKAVGPYVQARKIKAGQEIIYSSGSIGLIPETGKLIDENDVEKQATQALKNLEQVLIAGGSSLQNVIKTTVFVADMGDFKKCNAIYEQFFGDHKPARSCVAAKTLPLNALFEIECIALVD